MAIGVIGRSGLRDALVRFRTEGDERWARRSYVEAAVDARVGRAMSEVPSLVREAVADGGMLTHDDAMTDDDLDEILRMIEGDPADDDVG